MREKKPIDMNLVLLKAENIALKAELKTLKEQIEKMKCCENCKHKNFSFSPFCQKIGEEIKNPLRCKCSEWELKED